MDVGRLGTDRRITMGAPKNFCVMTRDSHLEDKTGRRTIDNPRVVEEETRASTILYTEVWVWRNDIEAKIEIAQ